MELNAKNVKKILAIITFGIILYGVVQNYSVVLEGVKYVFALIFPFVLGGSIAFILNVPMRAVETRLVAPIFKKTVKLKKLVRPISLIVTLLLVVAFIILVAFIIIPEIGNALSTIGKSVPGFIIDVRTWAVDLFDKFPEIASKIMAIDINTSSILDKLWAFVQGAGSSFVTSTIGMATGVANGLFSFFLALIFSLYIVAQKEKLGEQATKIMRAFLPKRVVDKTLQIVTMSEHTFSRFLSGQCIEALILGAMFFFAMLIFQFPYPLTISVLIGITALVPVFGAFIGLAIGVLLILIVSPAKALWFLILSIILQQIEGDFIYPHVVGNSVGLPSIWVLVAVTVGGSAMGISGMILFIPICSILYSLLRTEVNSRLKNNRNPKKEKNI